MDIVTQFILWAQDFVGAWGYLGIFVVSLVGNLSIILPIPAFVLVFTMGAVLNPWLVGLAGGLGGALGETSGYLIGMGGREVIETKYEKRLAMAKKWIEKHGIFPIILVFAATPLPSDIVGILAGVIRYDIRKFFLANIIGKVIMNTYIAWAGFYGINAVLAFLGG
jgi:membrane protein DedA with SNARE-associated domain